MCVCVVVSGMCVLFNIKWWTPIHHEPMSFSQSHWHFSSTENFRCTVSDFFSFFFLKNKKNTNNVYNKIAAWQVKMLNIYLFIYCYLPLWHYHVNIEWIYRFYNMYNGWLKYSCHLIYGQRMMQYLDMKGNNTRNN